MRAKQWVKNLLVFAVPALSGSLFEQSVLRGAVVGFVSFSLIASGAYLLNDVLDVEKDRRHPRKKHRPVAAGEVPEKIAAGFGVMLIVVGLGSGYFCGDYFMLVAGLYALHTFAYSYKLKHIATVEMVALSSGFILRVLAGGVIVQEAISQWLFACILGGALLMASGKRSAELLHAPDTRKVLEHYNEAYLTTVRSGAVALAVVSYALWIFDGTLGGSVLAQVSTLPYLTAILRYAQLAASGEAGEPEEIVLRDRILQFNGVVWAGCVFIGMFLV
jgi:decaprenyl-phosphate phosphoribosyltransferase